MGIIGRGQSKLQCDESDAVPNPTMYSEKMTDRVRLFLPRRKKVGDIALRPEGVTVPSMRGKRVLRLRKHGNRET